MSEFSRITEQIPEHVANEQQFTLVITDGDAVTKELTIHSPVDLSNPFALDLTQFIPGPAMRLEDFFQLASDIIDDAQSRAQIKTSERVRLVHEYQPENFAEFGDEVISTKVISREPGNMNRSATGRPDRKFRPLYEYISSREPNKSIYVLSRPIDHKIEFAAWAKTATLANARALWLERLFMYHNWAFMHKGAERFHWENRGQDTMWTHGGARLHQRTLKFFLRLREYSVIAEPILREINFHVSTDT